MKLSIKKISTLLLVLFVVRSNAQMTNLGQMFTSQNTDVSVLQNFVNKDTATVINNGNLYLDKDFNNNGIVTFTNDESAKTIFKGIENQKIIGDGITEFFNLKVDNNSKKTSIKLNKEIGVYGEANFQEGIIERLSKGKAVFKPGAFHNNLNDDSYIDNKVFKEGNEAFIFPVGHNNLGEFITRYTSISAPNNSKDVFSAEYIWENSDSKFKHLNKESDIININTNEYWIVKQEEGNSKVDVTLSWNERTTSPVLLFNPEKMVIVRWNGEKWINENGVVNIDDKTITTKPSGYGVFTLAIINNKESFDLVDSFSPDGDGINDTFVIPGLAEAYPNFKMKIYNRYGNLVFNYKNNGNLSPNWWDGKSDGRLTLSGSTKEVPAATYWYVIDFNDGKTKSTQSWLYLNK